MRDAAIPSNRQPRRSGTGRSAPDRPRGDLSSAEIAAQRLGGDLRRPAGSPGRRTATARGWAIPPVLKRVRPVKALTTVVFSAALVGIVANAVLFQKGLRTGTPFDILHGPPVATPAAPEKVAAADPGATGAVAAAPESAPAPAATPPTPPAADAAPATPRRPASARHVASKPSKEDAIGQLLGAAPAPGDKPAAKAAEIKSAEAKADPALLRAQRDLRKLGYAVKPDGHMDGGTRQAIRRFAHDHHLKDDAGLTPELRRQIADASSTPPKPAAEPQPKAQ